MTTVCNTISLFTSDPEPDTLHQKQSIMCAHILLDTLSSKDTSTAFGILNDVADTQTQIRETRGVVSIARDLVVDIAGLSRDNVRYVPFYTKSHVKLILDNYAEKISIYEDVSVRQLCEIPVFKLPCNHI